MDRFLSPKGIEKRKATNKMMKSIAKDLNPFIESTEFPEWLIDKMKSVGINGLMIKGQGGPELNAMETAAVCYELAKVDVSAATFILVHNGIGMSIIDYLGDEEQKQRLLPKGMSFEKIFSFGLTEPGNGSDASNLLTTAKRWKVDGFSMARNVGSVMELWEM